ncbi:MAG: helix-hairpin-helix domain-containing protein [bacterium]
MKKNLAFGLLLLCSLHLIADEPLQTFPGCVFVEADWADGDSFPVKFPDGRQITVRLYGADCIEWHVNDETLARRLRAQRRYFGIGDTDAASSMKTARDFGKQAAQRTRELLSSPFTIHTSFAGARGNGEKERSYAFVITPNGRDLATLLVEEGLARAYGVARQLPDGTTANEYRNRLSDAELTAAAGRKGIWSATNWQELATDRAEERRESAELQQVLQESKGLLILNPNTATAEELRSIPGIGKKLAELIIASRQEKPIDSPQDLLSIKGFSPKLVESITARLQFSKPLTQ